jgi:hypothetical protein
MRNLFFAVLVEPEELVAPEGGEVLGFGEEG